MRRFIHISLVLVISAVTLTACQNRAPSLRMLETRAGYNSPYDDEEVGLYQHGRHTPDSIARRSSSRVEKVYVYPHELPTHDYFLGGYVSLIVSQDEWVIEALDQNQSAAESTPAIRQKAVKKPSARKGTAKKEGAPL